MVKRRVNAPTAPPLGNVLRAFRSSLLMPFIVSVYPYFCLCGYAETQVHLDPDRVGCLFRIYVLMIQGEGNAKGAPWLGKKEVQHDCFHSTEHAVRYAGGAEADAGGGAIGRPA